jgi:hypothetical protein
VKAECRKRDMCMVYTYACYIQVHADKVVIPLRREAFLSNVLLSWGYRLQNMSQLRLKRRQAHRELTFTEAGQANRICSWSSYPLH